MNNQNLYASSMIEEYLHSGGLRKRLRTLLSMSYTLSNLHMKGLAYSYISPKHILVSTQDEYNETYFLGIENVDYIENMTGDGVKQVDPSIYTAPELYNGGPNTMYSNGFSFAILAFHILTGLYPFMDPNDEKGIFLEVDQYTDYTSKEYLKMLKRPWIGSSNNKIHVKIDEFKYFINDDLKGLFDQTLGEKGKNDAMTRTTLPEWSYMLAKAHDNVIRCNECGMDYYGEFSFHMQKSTCPWCHKKNGRLIITSYKLKNNESKLHWTFTHELNETEVLVPLRLVTGAYEDNVSDALFYIRISGDSMKISKWHYDYEAHVYSSEYEYVSMFTYQTSIKELLELKVVVLSRILCKLFKK